MINVHNLTKRFRSGGRDVHAVNGVSFVVGAGEAYGLLGPNGAGKTTTIRMIVGLLPPDAGYAEVGGFRTSRHPDEVKARLNVPAALDVVAIVAFGYPVRPIGRGKKQRKALRDIAHRERYGQPFAPR